MWKKIKKKFVKRWNRELDENDVDEQGMNNLIQKGAKIVDVRSPQEYKEGHIEGAISLPEYNIKKDAKHILPNLEEEILLYCSTGHRSKKAQKELSKMGYKNVYNLVGGIENDKS